MRKYMSSACVLLAAVLVAFAAQSCVGAPGGDAGEDPSYSAPGASYACDGMWQVDGRKNNGVVIVYPGYFIVYDIPYRQLAAKLFEGSVVADVAGSDGNDQLKYVTETTQDGTEVYTVKPKEWRMTATVDGRQCHISMYLSPKTGSADDVSWGFLSKNGVMSLVLCVAQYSVDGGDVQPSSVKLTYTAMRK